jgi:hypothetical protein
VSALHFALHFTLTLSGAEAGAPLRWALDLDSFEGAPAGWLDLDTWALTDAGRPLPFRVDGDTLDGRRCVLRFQAPGAGSAGVAATVSLVGGPRPPPGRPPGRPVPLVGAGEALSLGATDATGDLHVGLQTVVDAVDWYGRGRLDLLLCCLGHEGGAFLYAALDGTPGGPAFRRAGRLPGFGDDPQGYSGKVRAVDFGARGQFDLLECRGSRILWHRNSGAPGRPSFAPPRPLHAGGQPFDLGARSQMVCPVLLGDGRVSLIVGTNDWSEYWPKDVGAWEDRPGYRPFDEHGTWRGGPMHGRLYLLRNTSNPDGPSDGPSDGSSGQPADEPAFAAPVELCHEDGAPLEVYGLAGPAAIPAARESEGAPFDLVVADFLDRLWYFRCAGAPGPDGVPRFEARTPVRSTGQPAPEIDRPPLVPPPPVDYPPVERLPDELVLPTCMHAVAYVEWPQAQGGGAALLVAAEDGYVRALRWSGRTAAGVPVVGPPERIQEVGARLSVGAKACPNAVDWDGDGLDDLVLGNAAGQVLLCRNTGTSAGPVFAPPQPLSAGGRPLWLMAGPPGTMQGPSEVKWGYINPAVGPWPAPPGRPPGRAIVCGDALGQNTLYLEEPPSSVSSSSRDAGAIRSAGAGPPQLSPGRRLHVLGEAGWQPLVTRWRCRPQLYDWGEGQVTYLQVAADGTLTRYRLLPDGPASERGEARVAAHDRLRYEDGAPVRLDSDFGGRIGRLKLAIADWDGDGLPDLLVAGSGTQPVGANPYRKSTVFLLRNTGAPGRPRFARPEPILLDAGSSALFGGHSCVPAPCSLGPAPGDTGAPLGYTGAGRPDLLVGSENGRVYAFRRAYIDGRATVDARLERG